MSIPYIRPFFIPRLKNPPDTGIFGPVSSFFVEAEVRRISPNGEKFSRWETVL
jgi:hypothetical protein